MNSNDSTPPRIWTRAEDRRERPFEAVLVPLMRRRGWILLSCAVGGLLGAVYGIFQPNDYSSEAKLLVRLGQRENATADLAVDGMNANNAAGMREDLQNELQLLRNIRLFERTVDRIGPELVLRGYDPTRGHREGRELPSTVRWLHHIQKWWFKPAETLDDPEDYDTRKAAVLALQRRTLLAATRGSSVITITHKANNAEDAQAITDAMIGVAQEIHAEAFSDDSSFQFLKQQSTQADQRAQDATQKLVDYRQEVGIYDLELERQSLINELVLLQNEIEADGLRLLELRENEAFLHERVNEPTSVPNPAYASRQLLLENLRMEHRSLLAKYAPESEKVQAMAKQIRLAEDDLSTIEPSMLATGAEAARADPVYERLSTRYDEVREGKRALEVTLAQKKSRVGDLRKDLNQKLLAEPELARLVAEAAHQHRAAEQFAAMFQKVQVAAALDQADVSNLRVIQKPTRPYEKAGPSRPKFALLGFFGALFGAIFYAYVRNSVDQRIHRPEDIEAAGVPLLEVFKFRRRWIFV